MYTNFFTAFILCILRLFKLKISNIQKTSLELHFYACLNLYKLLLFPECTIKDTLTAKNSGFCHEDTK